MKRNINSIKDDSVCSPDRHSELTFSSVFEIFVKMYSVLLVTIYLRMKDKHLQKKEPTSISMIFFFNGKIVSLKITYVMFIAQKIKSTRTNNEIIQ